MPFFCMDPFISLLATTTIHSHTRTSSIAQKALLNSRASSACLAVVVSPLSQCCSSYLVLQREMGSIPRSEQHDPFGKLSSQHSLIPDSNSDAQVISMHLCRVRSSLPRECKSQLVCVSVNLVPNFSAEISNLKGFNVFGLHVA